MSEENMEYQIRNALDVLENHDLDVDTSRIPTYQNLERIIPECNIDAETASRLLVECTNDLGLIEIYKYALPVTAEIVKKIQAGQCPTTVNLVPSALGILNLINMLSNNKYTKSTWGQSINLACNIFLSYPNETLIAVAEDNFQKIKDLFENAHRNTKFFVMVNKILKSIPTEGIHDFVQSELQFWFMQLIPMSMNFMNKNESPEVIETLETLTETLVDIEYSYHPYWLNLLESILNTSRFPYIIKSLLEKQNQIWYRVWIFLIKLLKSQLTKVSGSSRSPINSMLHPVECAFKMDPVNKWQAFKCWNVLIDHFASENNHFVAHKQLKLLLIPLLAHNSKTELLAIAKFETWWHLIRELQLHVEQNADKMLIPFLHFCFGKPSQQGNVQIPPGQLSNKLKDLCVQAFITMFGHLDCDGCTTIPTLSVKLINTNLLTSYWEQWEYSLQKVMVLSLESDDVTLSIRRLSCVFMSLLVTLCDLLDNNIRMDLADYVFKIWIQYITDNIHKTNTTKIIFDVVIPAITDERLKNLFKIKDDKPSRSDLCALLDSIIKLTESDNIKDFVHKVKPLVVLWISESKVSNECVDHLIIKYLSQENSWPMWSLVADAVFDCASLNDQTIRTTLLNWPLHAPNLQNMVTSVADVDYIASIWTNLYSIQPKLNEIIFHDKLFVLLQKNEIVNTAHFLPQAHYFVKKVLHNVLNNKFSLTQHSECGVELLEIVLESINDSQLIEKSLPILVDLAVLTLNNLLEKEDKKIAFTAIKILKSILRLIVKVSKKHLQSNFTVSIQHLFVLVESFFKKNTNSEMKKYILDDLIFCHTNIPSELVEKKLTTRILKLFLSQSKDSDPEVYSKMKIALELENTDSTPQNFLDNNVSTELDAELNSSLNQSKSILITNNAKSKETEIENNEINPVHTSPNKNQETISNCIENSKNSQNADSQTPKANQNKGNSDIKKSSTKKIRIEHELYADVVEGHSCLNKPPEKRVRKKLTEIVTPRRNNSKKLVKTYTERSSTKEQRVTIQEAQEKDKQNLSTEDVSCSEDVVESSQDSTITAISIKSTISPKKIPFVILERLPITYDASIEHNIPVVDTSATKKEDSFNDSVFPCNKTAVQDKTTEATATMDTELIDDDDDSSDVQIISDDETQPEMIKIENNCIDLKTEDFANADTQSMDPNIINIPNNVNNDKTTEVTATMDTEIILIYDDDDSSDGQIISEDIAQPETIKTENTCIDLNTEEIMNADTQSMDPNILNIPNNLNNDNDATISLNTQNDTTKTFNECLDDEDSVSSPCKDKSKRKQDFLSNILEISPIKILNPLREEKTPSPETSYDYAVIQILSPVQSDSEPCEKCDSPEIFTEERVSPDKTDLSLPRDTITVSNLSPSSALSLKKNRPQVLSGGKDAQMQEVCVPDNEKPEGSDESKKSVASTTPARRNLRIIYNSVADNTAESVDDRDDDSGNFLKFKKSLPPVDSSPSGPILKRKLADITDDTTVTPVSKRKRVSFHDPPVSTTMSVIKYIEDGVSPSPSNLTQKRQARQTRSYTKMKSSKRLDNVLKLDTVLVNVKSVSNNETSITSTNDIEMSSIEETPVVEIVKISDLNDTDPICPDLVDCKDPISNIASELSSPSMSSLLTKELQGKVECIGDLAKLTELEVNRLCIKAPKVAVAKEVLADYLAKSVKEPNELNPIDETMHIDTDMPTNIIECNNSEEETNRIVTATASVQCEVCSASTSTQTVETGSKSIKDTIIDLKENLSCLTDNLDDTTKLQIFEKLPLGSISTFVVSKLNTTTSKQLLDSVIQKGSALSNNTGNSELSFVEDYISDKFQSNDLLMLSINLLRKVHALVINN